MGKKSSAVVAVLSLLLASVVVQSTAKVATASGESIAEPGPSSVAPSGTADLGGFVLSGFNSEDTLLVSIGFDGAPAGTSFSITDGTEPLTLGFGYTGWSNLERVSFTGSQSDANTALENLEVNASSTRGNFDVRVSATVNEAELVYNPITDHFYKYVETDTSWPDARTAAQSDTEKGVQGYLASITSANESQFVAENVTTDLDIWVGGVQLKAGTVSTDSNAEWTWVDGPEDGTVFWTEPASGTGGGVEGVYAGWCAAEPNSDAEPYVAIRSQFRDDGDDEECWNDWGSSGQRTGYLIEYGSNDEDKGFTGVFSATTEISVSSPITNQSAEAGNAQARVTWTAPASGTVSSYTVTSSPGSKTCTAAADETACTVVGLTNGTSYTFQIEASFSDGGGVTSLATTSAVTPVSSEPSLSGPSTASADEVDSVTLGTFTIGDPFSCGWGQMTATVTTAGGTVSASAEGSATVSNSGTASMSISGSRSDVADSLSGVQFTPNTSGDVTITTTVVPSVDFEAPDNKRYHLNEDTGHYYRVLSAAEVGATTGDNQVDKAENLAASLQFCGFQGYLVAVDNQDEQDFIEDSGAFDALDGVSLYSSGKQIGNGTWEWIPGDGAPAGEYPKDFFEQGSTAGTAPWHNGEPNSGDSNAFHTFWYTDSNDDGNEVYGWDDNTSNNVTTYGALVEYGATTSFSAPSVTTTVSVAPSYTVAYNGNVTAPESGALDSGSSLPSTEEGMPDDTVTVGSAVARQGLTFVEWNTRADGLGSGYDPGETFTIPSSNTTLYAQWSIPEAARLFGQTYTVSDYVDDDNDGQDDPVDWEVGDRKETIVPVVNDAGSSVAGNIRGIATDGNSVFFLPQEKNGYVREVSFDGTLVNDHLVTSLVDDGSGGNVALTSADQRELTYSSGCLFLRSGGSGGDDLYCIDVSTWTMVEVTPTGRDLLAGQGWLTGNLVDFPDGRIGVLSENNQGNVDDRGDGVAISCPTDFQCKTLRLYTVSGNGADVTLSHSRDLLLADDETVPDSCPGDYEPGWPCDNHGMATDGTYLYQSYHENGYKVFALRQDEPSYVVFNGDGSGACGANDGESGGQCLINFSGNTPDWTPAEVQNATFFARDHVNQRYLMGDYLNPQFIYTPSATPPAGEGSVDAPTVPRALSGSGASAQVALSWTAPASVGGAPINFYEISVSPGGASYTTTSTSLTVTGLTNGTSYTFTVSAKNTGGPSPEATVVVVPGAASSGSQDDDDDDSPTTSPGTSPGPVLTPGIPRGAPRLPVPPPQSPRPQILTGPVITPGAPPATPEPSARPRATIGGVPAPTTTTRTDDGGVEVQTGVVRLGVLVRGQNPGGGVEDNPMTGDPEIRVPTGGSTTLRGGGLLPGTSVQVWLPGSEGRELGRVPVGPDGLFEGDVTFGSTQGDSPLPIGRQLVQVTGFDAEGNQTVVDMPVNIAQGPPTPEPNRQLDALPDLALGQSLGTSAGLPVEIVVTGVPGQRLVTVEGDGWVYAVQADDSAVVENNNDQTSLSVQQSRTATVSGSGLQPGTTASLWLFSDPTRLGTVEVADDGSFSTDFFVDPQFVAPGEHTLQIQAVGPDGFIKAANLGVLVEEPLAETASDQAGGLLGWALGGLALVVAAFLFLVLWGRSRGGRTA